jgi:hypothetical protein
VTTLQLLIPVFMFTIPIISMIVLGCTILIKPVSAINRRWYLAIFLPLLIANPLALLDQTDPPFSDWATLIILLAADALLVVGFFLVFRGMTVYGLTLEDTQDLLINNLKELGFDVQKIIGAKAYWLGKVKDAHILTIRRGDISEQIWLAQQFNEIILRVDSRQGWQILKSVVSEIRQQKTAYQFSSHAVGILFIVLAIVFGALTWIFFFEPRLILIE